MENRTFFHFSFACHNKKMYLCKVYFAINIYIYEHP